MLVGNYVKTFAEASHALPIGMHMNADYPFMLPRIVGRKGARVTIEGRGGERSTFVVRRDPDGVEYGYIHQSSSYERFIAMTKPTRFKMRPFKDEKTPTASAATAPSA